MVKFTLFFDEVEHDDDYDRCVDDIARSGGAVVTGGYNYDTEEAKITVSAVSFLSFKNKFKETESYGFSNLVD
jgi:hypothetical protein